MKSKKTGHTIYHEPIYLGKPLFAHGHVSVYMRRKHTKTKKVLWCEMPVIITAWIWHGEWNGMDHQSLN